jgi:hypothetical protein
LLSVRFRPFTPNTPFCANAAASPRIEQNSNDALIREGYPIVGKNGVAAGMATNGKSVLMERAGREAQNSESLLMK